ncbi:MAG: hypothetical protein AB7U82_17460 [Blastocatellales bacterium]
MSKRLTNREKLLSKLNNLSENEITELLKYLATLEKGKRGDTNPETSPQTPSQTSEDELLILLSSARENRRARQVFEWESVRRRAEVKASIHRYR